MLKILGYPDRYGVAHGETIRFMVSLEEGESFEARLVRVVQGDENPAGPGLKLPVVEHLANGTYSGERQSIDAGSYMYAPTVPSLAKRPLAFEAWIWPTLPKRGAQTIAAQWDGAGAKGWKLCLSDGHLTLVTDTETISLPVQVLRRAWYRVRLAIDPKTWRYVLEQHALVKHALTDDSGKRQGKLKALPGDAGRGFMLAGSRLADGDVGEHFDGKIDAPSLSGLAAWDFSRETGGTRCIDATKNKHHGRLINLPARGVKGWNWTGEWHDFKQKPEHYGAIHFHHDDLYDAGWPPSVEMKIPKSLPSGAYALHVACGASDETATREAYIPFFVTPGRGVAKKKIAFLAPTCAYMAYANHAEHITAREAERVMGRLLTFGHADLYMYDHPELGGSLYDSHLDGSGVCYSSRLRPVLNFSPRYHSWVGGAGSALWQYNADTHLFGWLDHHGIDYDVITDEDLHKHGAKLLSSYRVVMTGTHPEYHSTEMWDGMKSWLDEGGRLMYLGANGWYWRIAFHNRLPGVIEVRRAEDGIRTWAAEPGEYYQSFNGEYGGLWRRVGRPPNLMCGVGFMAQGFDSCGYFRRAPDSYSERAKFIFEGVEDELIGNFGLIGGGAAGLELDAIAKHLGSPLNTLRLATSEGHSALVALVNEEFGVVPPNLGGDQNERVRADLAFFETPAGGAVFSASSISWCGSLAHQGYDNNVSRITLNVLKRFAEAAKFKA